MSIKRRFYSMTNVNVDRGADPAGGQRLPTPDPNHSSFGGKTEKCYKSVFFHLRRSNQNCYRHVLLISICLFVFFINLIQLF